MLVCDFIAFLRLNYSSRERIRAIAGLFLTVSPVPTYRKGERGKYQLVVSAKSWKSLKQKLKTITRKTTPMSFDERIGKLNEVQRGWINAFRMTSIQVKLAELDGWLRNRLRYCIWHHWRADC